MGLFRRQRPIETPEAAPVDTNKITVVILEFPPNFDATTPETRNPKLVFQHETDSVLSGLSNCSCRMAHGRRRPECCMLCHELKEALVPPETGASPDIPTIIPDNDEKEDIIYQKSQGSESSNFYSPRSSHKISPALKFLSKIVSPSSKNTCPTRSETEELQLEVIASPTLSAPRRHRKSRSAGNFFFGKQHDSALNQSQSLATDELSLYHELS